MPEQEPLYNLKAVVQETGIPAASLRAWERRYGILVPVRKANGHRVYPRSEVEKVLRLKRLMAQGMSISQAAEQVLHAPPEQLPGGGEVEQLRGGLEAALTALDGDRANRLFGRALEMLTLGQCLRWVIRPLLPDLTPFGRSYWRSRLGTLLLQAEPRSAAPIALVLHPDPKDLQPLLVAVLLSRRDYRVIYVEGTEAPPGLQPDLLIDPQQWDGEVAPEQLFR